LIPAERLITLKLGLGLMAQDSYIGDRLNRVGFEFLLRDIEIGLTFVQSARQSGGDPEKRSRNQANARKA